MGKEKDKYKKRQSRKSISAKPTLKYQIPSHARLLVVHFAGEEE